MTRKKTTKQIKNNFEREEKAIKPQKAFRMEFWSEAQKFAWNTFNQHDVLFLLGPAGTGKTFMSCAYAIQEILQGSRNKIILTRPIVEAGESLGFLPGTMEEKINPYMRPMYDCIEKCVGLAGPQKAMITKSTELAPIAYCRGRAQPLNSLVMTPNGPKQMKDIKVGNYVLGANGKPTKVLGVYPQGKKQIVEVNFNDGSKTLCCEDHLWLTKSLSENRHNKGYTVKTTKEISKKLKTKFNQKNHKIPMLSAPAEFQSQEVPLDSYLVGALLGDGSLHKGASIGFSTADSEMIENLKKVCPSSIEIKYKNNYDYSLVKSEKEKLYNKKNSDLKDHLRELGLLGTKSYNKFVPAIYLYNSVEIRQEMLRGLMDTDGSIYKDRNYTKIEFSSTSEQLAKDVVFLVQSLGGTAFLYEKELIDDEGHMLKERMIYHRRNSFKVVIKLPSSINPFKLTRKSEKFSNFESKPIRLINEIKNVGEMECQCIKVDAKDSLYLTDNFIVTHNTFDNSVCIFDEAQNATKTQLKLFLTRLGQNSKIIITGDPQQSDIRESGLVHTASRLEGLKGVGIIEFKASSIVRHSLIGDILAKLEEK